MHGNTHWTPQRLAWSALLAAWSEQPQLTERFHTVRSLLKKSCRHWQLGVSYGGWAAALKREEDRLIPRIIGRFRQLLRELPTGQEGTGWDVFAVDGSQVACPRTVKNQHALGELGKPDGIPQMALTSIFHVGTGLPWDFRVGPGTDSERTHLRDMLDALPADSLLVADAGFIGYDLCCEMLRRKQHFLLRVGGNVHLLKELGYDYEVQENVVYLWPVQQQNRGEPPLMLRLIVIQEKGKQPVYLVTSVLDPAASSDEQAAEIYRQRWGIEVEYRTVKQTMQHDAMHSRNPETCYQEMTWAFLGVWLLQLMTARQVAAAGGSPRCVSPAKARNCVRRAMRNAPPCAGSRQGLCHALPRCLLDRYRRIKPKASRNYPRKKQHKPPNPPIIKPATQAQHHKAKHLTPISMGKY